MTTSNNEKIDMFPKVFLRVHFEGDRIVGVQKMFNDLESYKDGRISPTIEFGRTGNYIELFTPEDKCFALFSIISDGILYNQKES